MRTAALAWSSPLARNSATSILGTESYVDWLVAEIEHVGEPATRVSEEWQDGLEAITMPTLVVWSKDDPFVDPRFGERLAARTRGELVFLEGCGHHWPFQKPAGVAAVLESFWTGRASKSGAIGRGTSQRELDSQRHPGQMCRSPSKTASLHKAGAWQAGSSLDVRTRVQSSFFAGSNSVPQPDLMVLPGRLDAFDDALPTRTLLVVEVALTSLPQDRLTKSIIYARAGVPCYWIVNLRDLCVEAYRDPDRFKSEYRSVTRATGIDILTIDDFPGVTFEAAEFLPRADRRE